MNLEQKITKMIVNESAYLITNVNDFMDGKRVKLIKKELIMQGLLT